MIRSLIAAGLICLSLSVAGQPGVVHAQTAKTSISIPNPIGSCNDATCLISRVVKSILGVIAIIATLMFIWGGLMMLTSGGNEKQIKQAKDTLVWAAIGIVVILISWAVIKFVFTSFLTTAAK